MMSTRASKRKRLNRSTVKNKKFKPSRSTTTKPRSESTTRSSRISTPDNPDVCDELNKCDFDKHGDIDINDDNLSEKSLVIECSKQADRVSTPINSKSKDSTSKGPLHSSTNISNCSPIIPRNSSTIDMSSTTPSHTQTTSRIKSFHSRVSRSEARPDQYLSPTTSTRKIINRNQLSSSPSTSLNCIRGSSGGIRNTGANSLSNVNGNTYGTTKNNICSSITTQSTSSNDKFTSQSTGVVPSPNLALLESIPEYRNLKKELAQERQRCTQWSDDYLKLRTEFDNYRANSFPRPSIDGLNFLLQLVENLTVSSNSIDSRTRGQLAKDIGLTEEQLTDCCHPNPQRAVLLVFSCLYPTHRERAGLVNIKTFAKKKSELMDNIFLFARQCNPSTSYTMDRMRSAIGGSIRQSKHQLAKFNNVQLELSRIDNYHIVDENDVEQMNEDSNSMMNLQKEYDNNNHSHDAAIDELDYPMDQ